MLLPTRSLMMGFLVLLVIYMFFQQRQQSAEIEWLAEKSKRQQEESNVNDLATAQQCATLQRERDEMHRRLEKTTRSLEETENKLEAAIRKGQETAAPIEKGREIPTEKGIIEVPSGSITVRRFDEAKFGMRWIKSLSDEERDHAILGVLRRSSRSPTIFPSTTGTSWKCYALSEEAVTHAFSPFAQLATGSACVFENLCFFDHNYQVIADSSSHPQHTLHDRQRFTWPQSLNGAEPTTTVKMVPDVGSFFANPNIEWVEDFSWMITNSYSRHTAHWLETISQIFIARNYLSDVFPPAKKVYLANHGEMFDWQKGTLLAALKQGGETTIHHSDALSRSSSNPICFRKAALPGYQFYFFTSRDVGIAYKHHVYETLGLSIPKTIPKVITV